MLPSARPLLRWPPRSHSSKLISVWGKRGVDPKRDYSESAVKADIVWFTFRYVVCDAAWRPPQCQATAMNEFEATRVHVQGASLFAS